MSVESMSKALRVTRLSPREKLVLIGIANHDGDGGAWPAEATLAAYADCTDRQVRRLIESLTQKGYLSVEVNAGGTTKTRGDRRPNLYTLHWERVDISESTGGHSDASRVDIQMSTEPSLEPSSEPSESSSLRSEELNARDELLESTQEVARAYWDWHVEEHGGKPVQSFHALLAVARACLKRDYKPEEIIDAMKALRARRVGSPLVIAKIGEMRRAAENRPSTAAIPTAVLQDVGVASGWFGERWPGWYYDHRAKIMDAIATLVRWGYGVGESMVRLAVAMHNPDEALKPTTLSNLQIDRFPGRIASDYIISTMEAAYKNKSWRAS